MAKLRNHPTDISEDFAGSSHTYFCPESLDGFEPETGAGKIRWKRNRRGVLMLFNHMDPRNREAPANEFPEKMYAESPQLPFTIEFILANTVRVWLQSSTTARPRPPSIMLADEARGGKLPVHCVCLSFLMVFQVVGFHSRLPSLFTPYSLAQILGSTSFPGSFCFSSPVCDDRL